MTQHPETAWQWLVQTWGGVGAIVFVLIALALCVSWLVTPVFAWRLSRKHRALEHALADLSERFAILSRHQQAERLKSDKARTKGRRRRRSGSKSTRSMPQA